VSTKSTLPVCGDFDVQVDYHLVGFTPPEVATEARVARLVVFDTGHTVALAVIERYTQALGSCNPGVDNYKAWTQNLSTNCDGRVAWASTSDMSGRLRITRTGQLLTMYYWNNAWVALKADVLTQQDVIIALDSGISGTGALPSTGHEAHFDNLSITAGSGLVLWLNPDVGVQQTAGAVSRWEDQSGFGNDALQSQATKQPVFVSAGLNGHATIRFDGTDDVLGLTGGAVMSQVTTFIVEKLIGGATGNAYYPIVLGGDANITGQYTGIETLNSFSGSSPDILDVFGGFGNDARATTPRASAYDVWRIISITTDGTIDSTTVRVNGRSATMSQTGSNATVSVRLGNATGTGFGGIGGSGNGLAVAKCEVAEVLVYDRVVTPSERADIENGLSIKYGLPQFGCSSNLADDFGDGRLSPLWENFGPCGPALEAGGELVLHRQSGCTTAVGARLDSGRYEICGDFDIMVDYRLANWPSPTGSSSQFTGLLISRASAPDLGSGLLAGIERFSAPSTDGCTPYRESYKFYGGNSSNCLASWVPTTDVSGRFRIARQGGMMGEFYWDGAHWIQGRTGLVSTDPVIVNLYAGTNPPDGQADYEAHMDNFLLSVDQVDVEPATMDHRGQLTSVLVQPNPFRSSTSVVFAVPWRTRARLTVVDVAGRSVATLFDGTCDAGAHRAAWDGTTPSGVRAAPGLYLVRMEAAGHTSTRKLSIER
jgi:hypothetical protein